MTRSVVLKVLAASLSILVFKQSLALGVIEVKFTLAKTVSDSKSVHVGKITKWVPTTGEVAIDLTETIFGNAIGDRCRINASTSPELKSLVAEGQTVLIMPSTHEGAAIVCAGNTWFLASIDVTKKPPLLKILQHKKDLVPTYPGRTEVLADLYRQMKANKPPKYLEKFDNQTLTGGIKDLGVLPGVAAPAAALAGDFDGDKKPDLAVATKDGVKVFTFDGKAFAAGKAAAPKDFPPKLPEPVKGADDDAAGPALAVVAGVDFSEANGAARIVVRKAGVFRETQRELDAGNAGADAWLIDDFKRLTGDAITTYPLGFDKGVTWAAATAIDVNGDGKKDVIVLTETNGIVMVSRGYGAFFVIGKLTEAMAGKEKLPFTLGPGTVLAAADVDGDGREDLLVINGEGHVWAVLNPAAK